MRSVTALGLMGLLAACGHSEPFTTADQTNTGPFSAELPVRLTLAAGADLHPAWSYDGSAVVYSFAVGSPDRDRCLGVLPFGGGTRRAEICVPPLQERGRTDAYTFGAMGPGGRIVANRHDNSTLQGVPQAGEFFVTREDSTGGRANLFTLYRQPAGGTAPWHHLVDPAWVSAGRVVALAAQIEVGSWNPFVSSPPTPFDTTFRASALVSIDVDAEPASWTVLAPMVGASRLAVDVGAGWIYVQRSTDRTPGFDTDAARLADTIYRVPVTGGPPEPIYGALRSSTELVGGVVGLAAGGGRLFLSEQRGGFAEGRPAGSDSRIVELLGDGSLRVIAQRAIGLTGRWGRIAASPDGTRLVAELYTGPGQADLYLLQVGP